jgi:hypothetical protein
MRWITTPCLLILAGRFIAGKFDVDSQSADTATYFALSFVVVVGGYFYYQKKR